MKFSYSLIKKLFPRVPALSVAAETLNFHSFEVEEASGDLLDINLPANRYSDAASHIGIARELAAARVKQFKNPVKKIVNIPTGNGLIAVDIEEKEFCSRYAAHVFEIGKLSATPAWIVKSLITCGLKPISPIVDLMNFVMLETGQPLHAFDADTIAGEKTKKIVVRCAKQGEHIITLDNQRVTLTRDMLVIADGAPDGHGRPLAIAGIKGGADSGVGAKTKRIIVEAANFDATNIFKTSRTLKLHTDAAVRFAHDISPELVSWGLNRVSELLADMGAKLVDSIDVYPRPTTEEVIQFDPARYESLVGEPILPAKAKSIFTALGFLIEAQKQPRRATGSGIPPKTLGKKNDVFLVHVPAWRNDIENEEDLIEELVRMVGYNELRPKPPIVGLAAGTESDEVILKSKTREMLSGLGLDEVYNYSFVSRRGIDQIMNRGALDFAGTVMEIANPLSAEFAYLRPSLAEGLMKNVVENSRFFDTLRIFEIGHIFYERNGKAVEELHVGLALAGDSQKLPLELKGIVAELLEGLGVSDLRSRPGRGTLWLESDHHMVGEIRSLSYEKKKWHVALAEINLGNALLLAEEANEYKPLPKFPSVVRDVSLLVRKDLLIGRILGTIQETEPELILNVDLVDEYEDEKLGNRQSLTFRIVFQAEDRTLTDEEVNKFMEKIQSALSEAYSAETR